MGEELRNQLIAIGIVAGSMATRVVRNRGFGLLGNIVGGVVGLPALFFRNRALSLPITALDRGRIGFSGGTTGMEGEDLLMATAVYLQQPAEDNR